MTRRLAAFLWVWASFLLPLHAAAGQNPAQKAHSNPLGFSYSLPADWQIVNSQTSLPQLQQQVAMEATSEAEKRGITCMQIAFTARHGSPASVVVVVALPFECFGETLTKGDLPGFAQGASEGVMNTLDIADPLYDSYSLGTHSMWIERSKGTAKNHPDANYTVETVCTVLKQAAVCWMALASDLDTLQAFEHGAVTLDGDAHPALVTATSFEKKSPQP